MQKHWSLYNKVEKLRVDDLKTEQVRLILLSIPTAMMPNWYACQEGDLHWQLISDIPEFYEDVRVIKGESIPAMEEPSPPARKPAPPRRPLFEDVAPELLTTDPALMVDKSETNERRSARRYNRSLMFTVINGGKSFQSETVDISMSGMALAAELPNWVPKTFRAEVGISEREKVRVLCRKVRDKKLKLMEAESWELIKKWIVNW